MNKVWIAGHLGADPETRFTPAGQKITMLRIATNSRRQGKDETIWWKVTLFGERFDKVLPYFKKGSGILVSGSLNPIQPWLDREGRPQAGYELVGDSIDFPPSRGSERQSQDYAPMGSNMPGNMGAGMGAGYADSQRPAMQPSRESPYSGSPYEGNPMKGAAAVPFGPTSQPYSSEPMNVSATEDEGVPF